MLGPFELYLTKIRRVLEAASTERGIAPPNAVSQARSAKLCVHDATHQQSALDSFPQALRTH